MNSQQRNSTTCVKTLAELLKQKNIIYEKVGRGGKILPECDRISHSYEKLAKDIIQSINKHLNQKSSEIVICQECGFISGDLSCHISKHRMNVKDYQEKYPGSVIKSQLLIDKVSGNKNPAFNHGGKYSPYSKKFIKYKDLSLEEVEETVQKIQERSLQTMIQNGNLNTTPEYYSKRGASKSEAIELLIDRQSTFSLEKCIKRFGEEEGQKIWQNRQDKWQSQLNSKSTEEKNEINKSKTSKVNYKSLWGNTLDCDGYFYLIQFGDNIKFGITSRDCISKRYKSRTLKNSKVMLFKQLTNIQHAFQVEQILKAMFCQQIKKADYGEFGWTEVIPDQSVSDILPLVEEYIQDTQQAFKKFEEYYGHTKRFNT